MLYPSAVPALDGHRPVIRRQLDAARGQNHTDPVVWEGDVVTKVNEEVKKGLEQSTETMAKKLADEHLTDFYVKGLAGG